MKRRCLLTLVAAFGLLLPLRANAATPWNATGTLFEACTCAVPCTCNFGQGPSPEHYCHATFAYRLDRAKWGDVDLSGLVIAGADVDKGVMGFLDDRATDVQKPALEKLALALFAKGGPRSGPRRFVTAKIQPVVEGNDLKLTIEGYGGYAAKVLLGRDGKNPIVVENNSVWPIPRATKAKTTTFTFHDKTAGDIKTTDTNSNYGAFDLSGVDLEKSDSSSASDRKE